MAISGARASVLDVGCGSGVLAIGAARLGAGPIVAIDNDPDAVRIAHENFAINAVDVAASADPLKAVPGRFDIVVANILPHVLIALRDELVPRVADGGVLLLSGIMGQQLDRVRASFVDAGMRSAREDRDGEWWALEMRATT